MKGVVEQVAKKFEFTGKEKSFYGRTVKRIRAIRDFGNVKKGKLGGWIESEKNLSHDGLCWVDDDAVVLEDAEVRGNAQVKGNAEVCGSAQVWGNADVHGYALVQGDAIVCGHAEVYGFARIGSPKDIFTASCVGSENRTLTAYRTEDSTIEVTHKGIARTLEEFTEAINQEHDNSNIGKEYHELIKLLRARFSA